MNPGKVHRIVVLERSGPSDAEHPEDANHENEWKAVEAEVGGERITVLSARVLPGPGTGPIRGGSQTGLNEVGDDREIVLVSNSDKAVWRLLTLPSATAHETRRMVALRLETELPYPVAESTWVCERQPGKDISADGNVLVIAVPTAEIAEVEKELGRAGLRCDTVMLDACALAELAVSPDRQEETLAVAAIGEMMTTLAITHRGKLRYARRIFSGSMTPNSGGVTVDAVHRVAGELDQCVHHYVLHTRSEEPSRLLLVGEESHTEGLETLLAHRLGMPVEAASLPENIHIASPEAVRSVAGRPGFRRAVEGDLLGLYAGCVGALLAMHRRLRGEDTAAPALRQRKPAFLETVRFKRAVLVGVNLLLLVALVAVLFGVRKAQMAAAARIVKGGRPLLQDMDRLRSEVDILEYEQRLRQPTLDSLLSLAEVLPKGLKIATLSIDSRGRVTITGLSPSIEEASEKAISAMNESKIFTKAKIPDAIIKEKDGWRFRITCELRKVPAVAAGR